MSDARAAEISFYADLYEDRDAGYGYPGERQHVALAFAGAEISAAGYVLDVSAGRGQFARLVLERCPGISVHVSEAVDGLLEKDLAGLPRFRWALPEPCPTGGQWDLVACLDVIEHLVPEDTEAAVEALAAVASEWLLLSIALFPCPWKGRETHVNLRPAEEWKGRLPAWLGDAWRTARVEERQKTLWYLARRVA